MKEIEDLGLTKQRPVILRVIQKSDNHLNADEVFDDARRLASCSSFAAAYNSLSYLNKKD